MPDTTPSVAPESAFPRGVCVFCGFKGSLTNEHVWPDWLARFVIEESRAPWVKVNDKGIERIWDAPMFHLRVRRVCAKCNHGWMDQADKDVRSLIKWMILGRDCNFDAETQAALALWCSLRAFMAQFVLGVEPIPPQHFHWIYQRREPPTAVAAWLACYGGRRYPVYAANHPLTIVAGGPFANPTGNNAYFATFSVGRFVSQVFGHHLPNGRIDLKPPPARFGLARRIWPNPSPINWPPPRAIGNDALPQFADFSLDATTN